MIHEITVKTALSPSKLPGLDYALNPYRGCEHACIYCYAPYVLYMDKGRWGNFVEPKLNLPRILSKELRTRKKGVVGLGTVTDPYQPVERKYELTRRCLELLLMHDFPVCIQTKSSLVLRDIDLLKRFSNIEVGMTLTSLDQSVTDKLEPGASGAKERLQALSELLNNDISTWVFLGPIMPYLSDIDELIDAIADAKPKYVIMDKLRLKEGGLENIMGFIGKYYPDLKRKYEEIFIGRKDYYNEVFENARKKCGNLKLFK